MKIMRSVAGLLLATSVVLTSSCGKDSSTPATTKVVYKISNGGNIITQALYTDSTGATITATSVQTDWTATTNATKPFTASLSISANNSGGSTIRPVLSILVNDTVKATREVPVPPFGQTTGSLVYTLQ